jgi:hypothetical protein
MAVTLGETLKRLRTPPKKGDHEIVVGPDGLAHMIVITHVDIVVHDTMNFNFMCPCKALEGIGDPTGLEVASTVSCLQCIQW